jgi:transposase InsO family protein
VTSNPIAEWIAGQVTDVFPWDEAPRHLIRNRDGAYGPAYTRRIRAMGIRDRPTAPRSPWQNGHVERLIGSVRRKSLDHLVVFGEAHLRDVLKAYASYYNKVRPLVVTGQRCSGFSRDPEYRPHRSDTNPRRAPSPIRIERATSRFADVDAERQQRAMDPRRAPGRILPAHAPD